MANPIDFKGQNFEFTAPPGMENQVRPLPVRKQMHHEYDVPEIVSCWELDEEERKQVAETGCVYLSILGEGMPPVYVSGTNLSNPDEQQ